MGSLTETVSRTSTHAAYRMELSRDRVESGSTNIPVANFPATSHTDLEEPARVASTIIDAFNDYLSKKDYEGVAVLFLENSYWRDHLCLSWDLCTLKHQSSISPRLKKGHHLVRVDIDSSSEFRAPQYTAIDGVGGVRGIQFYISVTTEKGTGRGVARLAEVNGAWKIFTFFTSLQQLSGHPEPLFEHRGRGAEHGGKADRKNWQEKRIAEEQFEGKQPTVVIIGAGQAGLTLAARLKMLNVDTLMIDSETRIGDNWRKRYHQLVLHDPVWYDHMPYLSFPAWWPVFTPKDKLADFFEAYAKLLELNVWTETSLESADWNEQDHKWTVKVQRRGQHGSPQTVILSPRHIVLATGHSGKMNLPDIPGMKTFSGDRICHSSEFSGAVKAKSTGKKAIVVGSCNSGHDIAQDFYEKGFDVTMVQRSSTCVVTSKSIVEIGLKGLFSEGGPPTEDADLWLWGMPAEVLKAQQIKVTKLQNLNDAAILNGLAKAGFQVDNGPDDSGLFFKYFQRGGGYYIDVGASQLIVDGKIKVKQGQEIVLVTSTGLTFADGTSLEADEIVFATGYQNMRTQARAIFGDGLADRINDVWGFTEHGEMRTIWQKSGHPGFWFMGGNLALCRYYSRILALQIKASSTEGGC